MKDYVRLICDAMIGWRGVPDRLQAAFAELEEDPIGRLAAGPVVIRRMRSWPLVLVTPVLCFLIMHLATDRSNLIVASIGGGVGLMLSAAFALRIPHELRLERDGFVLRHGRREIVCPWSLLSVVGHPFRAQLWVVLPVEQRDVDLVGLWRERTLLAEGYRIRTDFFKFDDVDQLRITGLELEPKRLGRLLQNIACAMSGAADKAVVNLADEHGDASRSTAQSGASRAAAVREGRRVRIACTRLLFPPECCLCGTATQGRLPVRASGRMGLLRTRSHVDVVVPCCEACGQREHTRRWISFLIPLVFVAIGFALIGTALYSGLEDHRLTMLLSGFAVSLVGAPVSAWIADRSLLRVQATYLEYQHDVVLDFSNAEYVDRVVDYQLSLSEPRPA